MGETLRILSANLWNGGADPDAFAELVVREHVDVVAVQELTPEQAEALGAVMPHGELHPARDFGGMGVAMRQPGKLTRVPVPHRDARAVALSPDDWPKLDAPIEIVNVHIMAPHVFKPQLGLRWRGPQMTALERYLAARSVPQRVVVGDFNATPAWPVYRRMAAQSTDAAAAVAERTGVRTRATWGPWFGAPRLARIDHAFVSGVEVEAFRVLEIAGSDHSAIVLDVTVAAAGGRVVREGVAMSPQR